MVEDSMQEVEAHLPYNNKKDGVNRFDKEMESNDDFWYKT